MSQFVMMLVAMSELTAEGELSPDSLYTPEDHSEQAASSLGGPRVGDDPEADAEFLRTVVARHRERAARDGIEPDAGPWLTKQWLGADADVLAHHRGRPVAAYSDAGRYEVPLHLGDPEMREIEWVPDVEPTCAFPMEGAGPLPLRGELLRIADAIDADVVAFVRREVPDLGEVDPAQLPAMVERAACGLEPAVGRGVAEVALDAFLTTDWMRFWAQRGFTSVVSVA